MPRPLRREDPGAPGSAPRAPELRTRLHTFLPAQFRSPLGLAWRLVRSGDAAAWFAMASSAMGALATPFDLLLQPFERARYRAASPPRLPLVFVAGPPRSGTTVVEQTLIPHLPVAYPNNLTSIFPRSPITANRIYPRPFRNELVEPKSYYGKTTHLHGPNDALYLWDRWFGRDRTVAPSRLDAATADDMRRFFGAFEAAFGLPLVNKNNSLNVSAHLVADALETARFLCLRREPVALAESLLVARRHIHGAEDVSYGIDDPTRPRSADPVDDVCGQVAFYERQAELQRARIGAERFRIVSYEGFCADPAALVASVGSEWLGVPIDRARLAGKIAPLAASRRRKLARDEHDRIREGLERRGIDPGPPVDA